MLEHRDVLAPPPTVLAPRPERHACSQRGSFASDLVDGADGAACDRLMARRGNRGVAAQRRSYSGPLEGKGSITLSHIPSPCTMLCSLAMLNALGWRSH